MSGGPVTRRARRSIAHVLFARPSLLRPLPEFALEAARAVAAADPELELELLVLLPHPRLAALTDARRRARGAAPWPEGLADALDAVKPRPSLVHFPPMPGRSTEAAAAALATHLLARPAHRRPELIHGSFLDEGGFAATIAARVIGARSLVVAHGSDARAVSGSGSDRNRSDPAERSDAKPGGPRPPWDRHRSDRARRALRDADAVIAVSHELAGRLARLGRRAEVIPFTTPAARFPVWPRPGGPPRLLFVGRIERAKGVDLLLDAVARLDRPELAVDLLGPLRPDLDLDVELLRRGLVGRVRHLAERPNTELAACYAAATALVLPSRAEGLAAVLVEALCSGRPVVTTDVGGSRELVDDRVGAVVPPDDAAALAAALARVLDRAAAGDFEPEALRAHALPFTWDGGGPRLAALSRRVLEHGS